MFEILEHLQKLFFVTLSTPGINQKDNMILISAEAVFVYLIAVVIFLFVRHI